MNNPFSTGAKIREIRKTDYHPDNFKLIQTASAGLVSGDFAPVIYMQDKYPTCGGHAPAPAANVLFNSTTSPKYMWDEIKQIDGFPAEDGTTMDAIFKSWKNKGITTLKLLNDTLGLSLADYTKISNINTEMVNEASTRKIDNYAFINTPNFQQIKDNLTKFKVAILLVDCGDGWYKNGWSENATCPLQLGAFDSHHFVCAIDSSVCRQYGITDPNPKYVYFINSWSEAWGAQGVGYFDESYISHVIEMGIPIVNNIAIPSAPTQTTQNPAKYQFLTDFGIFTTSADVHALQVILGVNPTGYFGLTTLFAVVKYQINNGIRPITGYIGPLTRMILNK